MSGRTRTVKLRRCLYIYIYILMQRALNKGVGVFVPSIFTKHTSVRDKSLLFIVSFKRFGFIKVRCISHSDTSYKYTLLHF